MSSSILRGNDNTNQRPYHVRYGSGVNDWEVSAPSSDDLWQCTADDKSLWNDWYKCIESGEQVSFHTDPHSIGGEADNSGAKGDFRDAQTSPNDPLFMFHHNNLERNHMWWMRRKHHDADTVCSYYGFPVTGGEYIEPGGRNNGNGDFEGAHLNDVASSAWGFTANDLDFGSDDITYLTHADLICHMNPNTSPYTYDTNIDCLTDSTTCNDVQGAITRGGSGATRFLRDRSITS